MLVWIILAVFALFLLTPEPPAPELDDEWARRKWLERHYGR